MISILFQHLGLIVLESELDVDLVFISMIKRNVRIELTTVVKRELLKKTKKN